MSATQKAINFLLQGGEIDPEALERFIQKTMHTRPVDPDAMQAVAFIVGMKTGVHGGDNMKAELRRVFRMRKINKGKFDFRPNEAAIDSPAFAAVLRHVRNPKDFTIENVIDEFNWYVAEDASPDTIKRWVEIIRPRAEKHLREEAHLKSEYDKRKNR